MNAMYAVILAGGKGERLWPLSREKKPKQLLPFLNNKSLLETALDRLNGLIDKKNRFIVTTEQQKEAINSLVGNQVNTILIEPIARNTGPAILLSCFALAALDPTATLIFLPADSYIPATEKFANAITRALEYCQRHNVITLLGVKPRFPATGYGYIEYRQDAQDEHIGSVIKFHEKPDHDTAIHYFSSNTMLWNIGIFCGKVSVFLDEYKKYAPAVYHGIEKYNASGNKEDYEQLSSISIDNAVMEKSKNIAVIPVDFDWSDVGNLEVLLSLQQKENNHNIVKNISIEAHNNLISSLEKKMIVLLGVNNICVVETDDVLLIVNRSDTEKVKLIVQELKKKKLDQYL